MRANINNRRICATRLRERRSLYAAYFVRRSQTLTSNEENENIESFNVSRGYVRVYVVGVNENAQLLVARLVTSTT